jgi:hypothetical protein
LPSIQSQAIRNPTGRPIAAAGKISETRSASKVKATPPIPESGIVRKCGGSAATSASTTHPTKTMAPSLTPATTNSAQPGGISPAPTVSPSSTKRCQRTIKTAPKSKKLIA